MARQRAVIISRLVINKMKRRGEIYIFGQEAMCTAYNIARFLVRKEDIV